MYLLDTDIISNLCTLPPSKALLEKLDLEPPGLQFTSSITLGELLFGAFRRPDRTADLVRRIEDAIPPSAQILPFDEPSARRYGELRAHLEAAGTRIGEADLRIAAIALAHNLTVVTGNVRHFVRVPGLTIENWLT